MKIITCWHDGEDYDERLCIQRRRSARIFAKNSRPLPFPHCLKCEAGMAKEMVRFPARFCVVCEKELPRKAITYCNSCRPKRYKKPKTRQCLICKVALPGTVANNMKYCDSCRREQILIQKRRYDKAFRVRQKLLQLKEKVSK